MKKIIVMLAVALALSPALFAQQTQPTQQPTDQSQQVKFYFYPASNVYFNVTSEDYWYFDEANAKWVEVKTLPETIVLQKTPVYTIMYSGTDVWKDNETHKKKYKKEEPKKDEPKKD